MTNPELSIPGVAVTSDELKFRNELAREVEAMTNIGHFVFDEISGTYLYISEGFARIYGADIEAYIAKIGSLNDVLSDIHEDDRARVQNEYNLYSKTGNEAAIEYRIYRADGKIRWVRELGKVYKKKNGLVTQTIGVIQDITDSTKREQELVFKDAITSEAELLSDIGYFLFDVTNNKYLFISPGRAKIVGMTVNEFRQNIQSVDDYIRLIAPEDQERVQLTYKNHLINLNSWQIEYRLRRNDGEYRWIQESGKALKVEGGRASQTIGILQDITKQKQAEQNLKLKDELATQAEAITDIGYFIYDEIRERYMFVSPGLGRIHGISTAELTSSTYSRESDLERMHANDRLRVQKVYDAFMAKGGEWQVEYRIIRRNGEIRWVRERGTVHLEGRDMPEQTLGVLQDITEQKRSEQEIINARDTLEQQVVERTQELASTIRQLREEIEEREKVTAKLDFLANHDALTGLPSLRLSKDRLEHSIKEAKRNQQLAAVMFLDLDGFKEINDSFGHELGDQVLKQTAGRIELKIRETDTVARIGGDEFLIILSSLPDSVIAERIAKSILKQISQPIKFEQIQISVSASIGISLYPNHGSTPDELIRAADNVMYRVKHAGKNNYEFAKA